MARIHNGQSTGTIIGIDTRNEESFPNLFLLPLCHHELNAQTHYIRYDNLRQNGHKTVNEHFDEATPSSGVSEMLVTYVVHTEQQSRYQRNNHNRHDTFAINRVVDVRSRFRSGVGHEQESFEAIEHRTKRVEFAALFKVRLYLIEIIS